MFTNTIAAFTTPNYTSHAEKLDSDESNTIQCSTATYMYMCMYVVDKN